MTMCFITTLTYILLVGVHSQREPSRKPVHSRQVETETGASDIRENLTGMPRMSPVV
jgi:hypothetical protein